MAIMHILDPNTNHNSDPLQNLAHPLLPHLQPTTHLPCPPPHRHLPPPFTLSGPTPAPTQPLILILPSVTCSVTHRSAVVQLLSPPTPCSRTRARATGSPRPLLSPPTAENIVLELYTTLGVLGIEWPLC
ncbi:hypothetical protein BGX38DRAFT_897887 [Terfezia claveryi]|nr:hypothetical protein BGX38DRAFT_897887 [Terfezia claveryi]